MDAAHNLNLFWFRRDLRLYDNHGLHLALNDGQTICCFIWDEEILSKLDGNNPRIYFIHDCLQELKDQLQKSGSDLIILHGNVENEIIKLTQQLKITKVFCNEDYEPWALKRDSALHELCINHNIIFHKSKDHVIFAQKEILNQQKLPYTVYTPYKNAWLGKLHLNFDAIMEYKINFANFLKCKPQTDYFNPTQIKFKTRLDFAAGSTNANSRFEEFMFRITHYHQERDFPAINTTSYMGTDLRFGTISIRQLLRSNISSLDKGTATWISELVWREFFSQIMFNFPHIVTEPFKLEYKKLNYINKEHWFQAWCTGTTGYPIVDAGMRQLNTTGFMHNRVRMICASFLCKDLLIDWRWGEQYFAQKLLDYDLASNNGNWQWCASTGCDAQPYFRIFNPVLQSQKFDPEGNYIRKYVPELAHYDNKQIHFPHASNNLFSTTNYPLPIVNHQEQAKLAKIMFATIKHRI